MSNPRNLKRLSSVFQKHQVYEAIFTLEEFEELTSTLHSIKHELVKGNKDYAVLGFLTEPNVASSISAQIKCGRMLVFVGWDLITNEENQCKKYTMEDLEKKLIDFSQDLRLN